SFDPAQVNVSRQMNSRFIPGICSYLREVKTPSRGEYLLLNPRPLPHTQPSETEHPAAASSFLKN
ncbi:MAG TPA: hypothetical protein PK228_18410, partial [Saprospiraceae bacterium]|nr:hypothetical protein [Saprospiraceae bacterium]